MSKMKWDQTSERLYEVGVEQCALFPQDDKGTYSLGVAWNGMSNITESPSGAEATKIYANNGVYATIMSAEEYAGSIEAYMSPVEFDQCDGSVAITEGVTIGQQTRKAFGLAYKTLIGNDVVGTSYGYKLHIVYGALASPSEKAHATVSDSVEPEAMSWEFTSTPVPVAGHKPTATVTIDSTKVNAEKLAALEAIIYGSEDTEPRLPLPDEIMTLLGETETAG